MAFGKANEAEYYYNRALATVRHANDCKNEHDLLVTLGCAHHILGNASKSIGYFEEALESARRAGSREGEAVALFDIGDAFHLAGKLADAARYYKQALEMDKPSTNYKCASGLGVLSLQERRSAEARRYFALCVTLCHPFLEQPPRLYPRYSTLALAQLALGRTHEGLAILRQALETIPTEEAIRYALGDFEVLKRVPHCIRGLNEAIQLLEEALVARTKSDLAVTSSPVRVTPND